jgi:hypothetical protein
VYDADCCAGTCDPATLACASGPDTGTLPSGG